MAPLQHSPFWDTSLSIIFMRNNSPPHVPTKIEDSLTGVPQDMGNE
uniref:Uncharacterized protein n=1 Tax=Lepeophtheirus salmonis TaxID=72036 RepID=A0A0K2VF21_LEPSM